MERIFVIALALLVLAALLVGCSPFQERGGAATFEGRPVTLLEIHRIESDGDAPAQPVLIRRVANPEHIRQVTTRLDGRWRYAGDGPASWKLRFLGEGEELATVWVEPGGDWRLGDEPGGRCRHINDDIRRLTRRTETFGISH